MKIWNRMPDAPKRNESGCPRDKIFFSPFGMCVDVEVCTPHGCVDVEISQHQTAGCFQRGEGGNECSNDGAEYFLPGGFVASLGHISSSFFKFLR